MAEVWSFRPTRDMVETLSWFTNVMRAGTAERRVSVREARQGIALRYSTRDRMIGRMVDLLRTDLLEDWLVPVWFEATRATGILAGDTVITVDPSEYVDGGKVLIWAGTDDWTAADILTVGVGEITLTAAVGAGYTTALVMPLRLAYLSSGIEYTKVSNGRGIGSDYGAAHIAQLNFEFRDEGPTGVAPTLLYSGVPVIKNCGVVTPLAASLTGDISFVDNEAGPVSLQYARQLLSVRYQTNWRMLTAQDRYDARSVLRWMNGRDSSFYISNWGQDLKLTAAALSAATTVRVRPLFPDVSRYVGKVLAITDANGAPIMRLITNATAELGYHRLTVAALGRDIGLDARLSFLRRVRLDTDVVELNHVQGFVAETMLPLIEVST